LVAHGEPLCGLDSTTCGFVLTTLVGRKVLRRTPIGKYLRGTFG
jgi:hypothetical protein